MKILLTIFSTIAFLLTTSCAYQARNVSATAKPDGRSAILFGRFDVDHTFAYENRLAIWLQNLDHKKSIYIFFDADHPLQAVNVEPGRYQVVGFIGVNRTHQVKVRKQIPMEKIPPPFIAAADSQIYLGDYLGTVTYDSIFATWGIKSVKNNFTSTTLDFRKQYPKLNSVPPTSIFDFNF